MWLDYDIAGLEWEGRMMCVALSHQAFNSEFLHWHVLSAPSSMFDRVRVLCQEFHPCGRWDSLVKRGKCVIGCMISFTATTRTFCP